LPDGVTTIEVTVHDQAVPPNVRTETWSTTRISNIAADADHNGIGALMEYAFNAAGSHGFSVLPQATPGIDPETDERCLNLTFRRRINATGLDYLVETSCNLVDWQPVGADADTLSVTPAGDGVTEVVSMRIRPPDGVVPCFARVRVVVP
ncbi:MAG TPA: hypothetical protein VD994_21695, partial [Prosthecobacter sp.]|nr:hypothetical protein [Prosthecobacter sp.]